MRTILDSLAQPFFRRALLEAVMVGALGGVVGVHVMLRRLPFFVVAMSHATLPGIAVATTLGLSVVVGGVGFGLLIALAVVAMGSVRLVDDTSVVGVVLAGAFAVGVLIVSARPGSSRDLSAYLVGSVITVSARDLLITALVGAGVLTLLALLHKELVLSVFDPLAAQAAGYPARILDLAVLGAVTVTLALATPAVGTLLSVTLLTLPALAARLWASTITSTMALAAGFGALSGIAGLFASAFYRVGAGGAIALSATVLFAGSFAVTGLLNARRGPASRSPVPTVSAAT